MFGRLTEDALPLYSEIAMAGAAVTVGGGLFVLAVVLWTSSLLYLADFGRSQTYRHYVCRRGSRDALARIC